MSHAPLAGSTVLAMFAHPDDESLACGGTLARLVDEGAHVIVWSASHGERGAETGPARDDALGGLRATELRDAVTALGVQELIVGDHPDGDLQWSQVSELLAELMLFVRHRRPDAVITFGADGLYWHRDHIGIFERVTTALRALGSSAPPLYHVTMARGVMTEIVSRARDHGWTPTVKGFWSLEPEAYGIAARPPEITIDVREQLPRKLAAILAHKSQMGDGGHPFDRIRASDAPRLLGQEYFHRLDATASGPGLLESLCVSTP
jgi:LmbE family N-acetylglucosaminyl deacetylase